MFNHFLKETVIPITPVFADQAKITEGVAMTRLEAFATIWNQVHSPAEHVDTDNFGEPCHLIGDVHMFENLNSQSVLYFGPEGMLRNVWNFIPEPDAVLPESFWESLSVSQAAAWSEDGWFQ